MIKYSGEAFEEKIYEIVSYKKWNTGKMSPEWDMGMVIPILKKGNPDILKYVQITEKSAYSMLTRKITKSLEEMSTVIIDVLVPNKRGLVINLGETKYLRVIKNQERACNKVIDVRHFKFEAVKNTNRTKGILVFQISQHHEA